MRIGISATGNTLESSLGAECIRGRRLFQKRAFLRRRFWEPQGGAGELLATGSFGSLMEGGEKACQEETGPVRWEWDQ